MGDRDEAVRRAAEMALFEVSEMSSAEFHNQLVDAISSRINHTDEVVHRCAVSTLARIAGNGHADAMSVVVSHLGVAYAELLYKAVQKVPRLHRRGDAAAISAVAACFEHRASDVRGVAINALTELADRGNVFAKEAVLRRLQDDTAMVRCYALSALEQFSAEGD